MTPLITMFAETIAAQHADLFDPVVRLAYSAGATPEDLLTAVEVAKARAEVPPGVARRGVAPRNVPWPIKPPSRPRPTAPLRGCPSTGGL